MSVACIFTMSDDTLSIRIKQFTKINCEPIKHDVEIQECNSSSMEDTLNLELKTYIHNRTELKAILLNISRVIKNQNNELDKHLKAIGELLGQISTKHYALADKNVAKLTVECLVRLAMLDSASYNRASNWAKSRLRHMLSDDPEREQRFAIPLCGFEDALCNDMTSEMTIHYLCDQLENCKEKKIFSEMVNSLDIGKLIYIPQATKLIKTLKHSCRAPNDTNRLIYLEADQDENSEPLVVYAWLDDLDAFESAVVDLIEVLLQKSEMARLERLKIIEKSLITKSCATYLILKDTTELILECFKEQSNGNALVHSAISDITYSIKEMERSIQPVYCNGEDNK